nr:9114_t:CDS:2 [Entrophospora candida]
MDEFKNRCFNLLNSIDKEVLILPKKNNNKYEEISLRIETTSNHLTVLYTRLLNGDKNLKFNKKYFVDNLNGYLNAKIIRQLKS